MLINMYPGYDEEVEAVKKAKNDVAPPPTIKTASLPRVAFAWPDSDDIAELAKSATPALFKRAVELALASFDPRLVRDVAQLAADRAHGKPHQSTSVSGGATINIICNIPNTPNSIKQASPLIEHEPATNQ